MLGGVGKRRLIGGAVVSLVINVAPFVGRRIRTDRYLEPIEEPGWTSGSVRR